MGCLCDMTNARGIELVLNEHVYPVFKYYRAGQVIDLMKFAKEKKDGQSTGSVFLIYKEECCTDCMPPLDGTSNCLSNKFNLSLSRQNCSFEFILAGAQYSAENQFDNLSQWSNKYKTMGKHRKRMKKINETYIEHLCTFIQRMTLSCCNEHRNIVEQRQMIDFIRNAECSHMVRTLITAAESILLESRKNIQFNNLNIKVENMNLSLRLMENQLKESITSHYQQQHQIIRNIEATTKETKIVLNHLQNETKRKSSWVNLLVSSLITFCLVGIGNTLINVKTHQISLDCYKDHGGKFWSWVVVGFLLIAVIAGVFYKFADLVFVSC